MATTSNVNFVTSMGAGSGVDTKSLAQNLVEAERAPRKSLIDAKIQKEEAHITGYGAIKSLLSTLQSALAKLNDTSDFSSITPSNTQPAAFGVTASTSAEAASYSIEISQIAKATRLATDALASTSTPLNADNNNASFDLTFAFSSGTKTVSVDTATPAGIVKAVNASSSSTGVSAQLIKSGTGYSIVFSGATGADNDFSISGLPTEVTMRADALQTAQDAEFTVNGLPITSSSNSISDTIPGVTLDLYAPTTSGTAARLDLNRQTNAIKDNLNALVSAYNDFNDGLKELGDSKSALAQFGGTLAGDSTVNTVRNLVRGMFVKDGKVYPNGDKTQDPLNPDVNAAWQVGISFDRYGKMTLDEGKLDKALTDHFDQVVTFFTANGNGQSVYSTAPGGMAGDAVKSIDKMLRTTGLLAQQTDSANARIKQYNDQLAKLEDRMAMLLDRYTKQFSVMDSIVGESSSTRTSLKSSFDGLMAMYTKG